MDLARWSLNYWEAANRERGDSSFSLSISMWGWVKMMGLCSQRGRKSWGRHRWVQFSGRCWCDSWEVCQLWTSWRKSKGSGCFQCKSSLSVTLPEHIMKPYRTGSFSNLSQITLPQRLQWSHFSKENKVCISVYRVLPIWSLSPLCPDFLSVPPYPLHSRHTGFLDVLPALHSVLLLQDLCTDYSVCL